MLSSSSLGSRALRTGLQSTSPISLASVSPLLHHSPAASLRQGILPYQFWPTELRDRCLLMSLWHEDQELRVADGCASHRVSSSAAGALQALGLCTALFDSLLSSCWVRPGAYWGCVLCSVTSLNFLTDSFSLSGRLPDTGGQHHLGMELDSAQAGPCWLAFVSPTSCLAEAARREASGRGLGTRIERHPRLERELSDQGAHLLESVKLRLPSMQGGQQLAGGSQY